MSEGYIYVLANSSMQDMVKVGRTTRKPSERAQELSGVTGIPTPFMVVYESYVSDCIAAEMFIHALLERKGFRVAKNREFFKAPVAEVISAALSLPDNLKFSASRNTLTEDDELLTTAESDELSDLNLPDEDASPPWLDLWLKAEAAYFGAEDTLQDFDEALQLYRDAAKLGCNLAYYRIGDMHLYGKGVAENTKKALDFFKEGAKNGNYLCYERMAFIFSLEGMKDNVLKCIKLFLKNRSLRENEIIEIALDSEFELISLIKDNIELIKLLTENEIGQIRQEKEKLQHHIDSLLSYRPTSDGNFDQIERELKIERELISAKNWLNSL